MDEVSNLLERPKAYFNIDGVGELGIGLMLLSFGLVQWQQVHSPEHSFWNRPVTFFIFVGLLSSAIHYGSKAVKNRITYPRTGFVEYPRRDRVWKPLAISFVVGAVISAAVAMTARRHLEIPTPGALIGLVFAGAYAHGIARLAPWKWTVAAAMVLAAVGMALAPAEWMSELAAGSWITRQFPAPLVGAFLAAFVLYGAIFMISGAISFCLYLRQTQAR